MALPEHPIGSTVRSDEEGSYVAYHKACKSCQVELTSRNRASGGSLKCRTCSATTARAVYGSTGATRAKPKLHPPKEVVLQHTTNPDRQKVHSLLTKFLSEPRSKFAKGELLASLVDYELINRFRDL